MGNIKQRLRKLRAALRRKKLDSLIVTNVHNVRYLSGFTGDDSALLVALKDCMLITDSRFTESAEKEVGPYGIEVHQRKKSIVDALGVLAKPRGLRHVGFVGVHVSFDVHRQLSDKMKGVELRPAQGLVEGLRQIKDASEIKAVRRAVKVAEDSLRATIPSIQPGVSEMDVATELDHQMRKRGAQESAFPIIVAGGERASLPHARPTKRKICAGEAVLIDWGARLEFYNSDLTRVLFLGTITRKWQERYESVLRAQCAALRVIRRGMVTRKVDCAARNVLRERRLAKRFGHGVGHGISAPPSNKPRACSL